MSACASWSATRIAAWTGLASRASSSRSEDHLKQVIEEAKRLLPRVEISPTIGWFIALVCIDAGALGHRADIVVSGAARTVRAWDEAERLVRAHAAGLPADVGRPPGGDDGRRHHRRRARARPPAAEPAGRGVAARPPPRQSALAERFEEIAQEAEAAVVSEQTAEAGDQPPDDSGSGEEGESPGQVQGSEQATQAVTRRSAEQLFEGEIFPVRKIALPRDRRSRSTTGKRSSSQSSDKRGPLRPRDPDREDDRHRVRRHHARSRAAPGPPPCRGTRGQSRGRRSTSSVRISARRCAAAAPAR